MSSTLIDVIFTSHPDNVSCSGVSHDGISDHGLIYVFRKISLPSVVKVSSTISYRQFKNFDRNRFRSDILAQPWTDLIGIDNPNEMWLKWKSLFLGYVHTKPDKFENATSFIRIGLPSTLKRCFRCPKTELFENALQSG